MGTLIPLHRIEGVAQELSDQALVSAMAVGDPAALGALFDRLHLEVYRFLARMVGADEPALDDLVQATFLEAYQSAPRFCGRSAVRTWIFGIAANLSRHHIRSEVRRRDAVRRFAQAPHAAPIGPDAAAERSQLLERLAAAVEELPYALRVAYVLCVIEELPGAEVARALGIREGTLWRRLHDARVALRAALERRRP